jgi:hypothetical protein
MNFSNKTNDLTSIIFGFYTPNIMNILGVVFNLWCILIFIEIIKLEQRQRNKGHLYKYLFIKSICDCLFCLQNIPQMFYFKVDFTISDSYLMQLWFIYCFYYLYPVLSMLSVWFEVFALIDCLCLISDKMKWHKNKIYFYSLTTLLISLTFLSDIPYLFWFKIEENESGGYRSVATPLGRSKFLYYYALFNGLMRDCVPLFISIVINGFIFYFIRESTVRRMRIHNTNNNNNNRINLKLIQQSQKAQINKIKMIFFTSFIHLFHIPVIFYNLNVFNVQANSFMARLCILSFNFSYFIPIITFTAFNLTFKRYFFKMISFYK